MGKRARSNSAKAIGKRLDEGRGQGRGHDYKPWLLIHDVPSIGLANRIKSPVNGRTYHLMSQLEADWFFALHALSGVVDIREQYPLLDLEETEQIAADLKIKHPTDPQSKTACVATSDFVVTFRDGPRTIDVALAIKFSSDLSSTRTLEKLEIERVYWAARGIKWSILTELELPRTLVKNMRWLFPHLDLAESGAISAELLEKIRNAMSPEIEKGSRGLADVAAESDDRLGLAPGTSLSAARCLIGTGVWPVDLTLGLNPRNPIRLLNTITYVDLCKFAA